MPRGASLFVNALLPGSVLLFRGAPVTGTALLAGAVLALTAVALGPLVTLPGLRPGGVAAYGMLACLAAIAGHLNLRPPADAGTMRRLHATAAAAWLRNDHAVAMAASRELVRIATAEPGAWRLLGLIATDPMVAADARRRAERLETVED